ARLHGDARDRRAAAATAAAWKLTITAYSLQPYRQAQSVQRLIFAKPWRFGRRAGLSAPPGSKTVSLFKPMR
ncbi:hypothetical protein, partial [Mesorhizobium sp. M7A.F.Ca.CA.004.02.1.1]|uniref:hypothetical protein n=1 Tax=Mesorhizobium sp. M7A.F.Ca.CA.004.02.1.1 TaxID=2496690 RepID=UPI0019D011E0